MPANVHLADDRGNSALGNYDVEQLVCIVHSSHPLTLGTIRDALSSVPAFRCSIKSYDLTFEQSKSEACEILVLDTCSVGSWREDLERWRRFVDGRAIALISPDMERESELLKMLSLGVAGIVSFCEDLDKNLPRALAVVSQGGLWVGRPTLNEYVKRTRQLLRYMSAGDRLVTPRERQIIDFLREGVSNKEIASALHITERTVKFHVSNILRKCEFESRRELRGKPSQSEAFNSKPVAARNGRGVCLIPSPIVKRTVSS